MGLHDGGATPLQGGEMKITDVEVLPIDRYLFVQVHTDEGLTGLGESGTHGHQEAARAALEKFGR
jgi:galactonate dehydratase